MHLCVLGTEDSKKRYGGSALSGQIDFLVGKIFQGEAGKEFDGMHFEIAAGANIGHEPQVARILGVGDGRRRGQVDFSGPQLLIERTWDAFDK